MEEKQGEMVDFFYNGTFFPKPLLYFRPRKVCFTESELKGMNYNEFIEEAERRIQMECKTVYFCVSDQTLSQGLHCLQNACDYDEFLEVLDKNRVSLYLDHDKQPLFEWIQMEEAEAEEVEDSLSEEEQSVTGVKVECDHEEDDEIISTQRTFNDHFLNRLCPVQFDNPDEDNEPVVYPRYNDTVDWDRMEPELGMRFSSPTELKTMLTNYAVAHGYDLYFETNDKQRLLVKCCKGKTPQCTFRLWASWMKEERSFQIKSLVKDHICSRAFKLGCIVTYKWIGKNFVTEILENPRMSLRKMKAQVSKKFNLNVSLGQCRNAKKLALNEIEGCLKDHYAKLWDYASEIRRANPGSNVKLCVEPQNDGTVVFDRLYISFKGVVNGWLHGCRKVIGVDGCFLKGICKGELLSAVGRDGNNHIYPIAWAVVSVENKSTWKWFLDNLLEDIDEGGTGDGITILSDGHKGLLEAVKERCPAVEHRLCARHILANFHKKFKGECYMKPFWKAVNATTIQQFDAAMEEIKSYDVLAHTYLIQRDPSCWSKAFFKVGMDCDAVENGVSESFNSAIEDARRKPLITMLEDIRVWVMERLYKQKEKALGWDLTICPAIRRKVEDLRIWQR